jgi:hypothetical protein
MKAVCAVRLILLAASALLLNGCATQKLWEQRAFCEPASPPNLELSFDGQRKDVLVRYDEFSERSNRTRPRAYFLYQNLPRLEARRKPDFVTAGAAAKGLMPLPMLTPELLPTADPNLELYAVAATNSARFALYSKGRELGAYDLPVYPDGVHRTRQILLTPVAVAADVTFVSAVVGFVLWAEGGFYPLTEQSRGYP